VKSESNGGGKKMKTNELSSMSTPEFIQLLIEEHLRIAEIHDGQAIGCQHKGLKKGHEETAAYHRLLAHRFSVQRKLDCTSLGMI
jgi:hypothetical protein